MKTTKNRQLLILAAASVFATGAPQATAQGTTSSSILFQENSTSEAPKTAMEKLGDLQTRHNKSFSELSANLNRLPSESGLLGSKALFELVDESVREMKNIRSGSSALLISLRSVAKTVGSSSSFSEEQKQELTVSAEALAKDCSALSGMLDLAIKRLDAAYTLFPKWSRIHKSYCDLQGEAKASQVVKSQVEEYLKSFTPDAPSPANNQTSVGNKTGQE